MRAGLIALVLLCVACTSTAAKSPASPAIGALAVRPAATMAGYSRAQFGPAWADVDHNGCDTRNDVLNRDLADKQWRSGTHQCVVIAGTLRDPYTASAITFRKAQADEVQIDHVVALGNAWKTGAAAWNADRRKSFANDPLNLLAVDGHENQSKGDGDASEYLPPNPKFRCAYVQKQIAVKTKYQLSITPAERDAMSRALTTCSGSS